MSPELDTLDQLQGGDLPIPTVRSLFESDESFSRALIAMLEGGEVRLILDSAAVPPWRWRELKGAFAGSELRYASLAITEAGARRIC